MVVGYSEERIEIMEWLIILFFIVTGITVNLFERKIHKKIDDIEYKTNRIQDSINNLN